LEKNDKFKTEKITKNHQKIAKKHEKNTKHGKNIKIIKKSQKVVQIGG